jgi:hypothetical protein
LRSKDKDITWISRGFQKNNILSDIQSGYPDFQDIRPTLLYREEQ